MLKAQNDLLKNWHLKFAIVSVLIFPTVTAVGAYYDLRNKITQNSGSTELRMSQLELQSNQQFADKTTLKEMQDEQRQMHDDILQIKTILTKRFR